VAQPQTLQCIVRIVRGPQMYWVVFSGCPQSSTELDSYNAQSAPLRRQIEQLQSIRYSGFEGTLILTAPQWQVAEGIVISLDCRALNIKASQADPETRFEIGKLRVGEHAWNRATTCGRRRASHTTVMPRKTPSAPTVPDSPEGASPES
jgi:hypothetical protein